MQIKRKRRFQNIETAFNAKRTSNIMLMSRTVAQPVAHNERAGMFMKVVLKAVPGVRCVVCWCVVLCCVVSGLFRGTFLEQLFEPFDGDRGNPPTVRSVKNSAMTPPPDPHLTYKYITGRTQT